jgi:hypothetical protein
MHVGMRQFIGYAESIGMRWRIHIGQGELTAGSHVCFGFMLAGEIPDYSLKPRGGLIGTIFYWKRIGEKAETAHTHL